MTDAPLHLFNSLTRQLEEFRPVHESEARVYTCGPTVYNYPHIGNMRAYVFADILGRTLSHKGYDLTHIINITDVGHLTDDADAGEDKMEKMASEKAQSIWDIAQHYTQAYWADVKALNIRQPAKWSVATDYIAEMLEFAKGIADKHCYELESGLYFDVSTIEDYGRLAGTDLDKVSIEAINAVDACEEAARQSIKAITKAAKNGAAVTKELDAAKEANEAVLSSAQKTRIAARNGRAFTAKNEAAATAAAASAVASMAVAVGVGEMSTVLQLSATADTFGRIDTVEGKRNAADFAIWRKTPAGEKRQMEWDSPWGKGAPGWHLECSVMGEKLLGFPFDIHTGGIDHREIHHPNEIAQNQAFCGCGGQEDTGLSNARNSGANIWMHNNFLVERSGKMSKSSGEFLRLQLLVDKGYHPLAYRMMCLQAHYRSELEFSWEGLTAALTRLKRIVMLVERIADAPSGGVTDHPKFAPVLEKFEAAIADDLNTSIALTALEDALATKKIDAGIKRAVVERIDSVLGLGLFELARTDLRIRPKDAVITEEEIDAAFERRKVARAEKDFAASDAIRDELAAQGVEVMDGDPMGWEWKLT